MGPVRLFDDRRSPFDVARPPKRVVSLVPSDTYTMAALGCGAALVGRTDYCDLPADVVVRVPSVGGTKNPRVADILDLAPDLVLANQEENTRRDVEALEQKGIRVFVAFPKRVADGLAHLSKLVRIFGVESDATVRGLVKEGYEALRIAESTRAERALLRVFCPIWMDPLMTIHGDTFISDMLALCGGQNVFADRERRYPLAADLGRAVPTPSGEGVAGRDTRYPRITFEEVLARRPDSVVLPDEPHPFSEADADTFRALPWLSPRACSVVHAHGKDLCWYGAWSAGAISRVQSLLAAAAETRA